MTALVRKLGLSELSFQDVYSIDDPDLIAFVPRPVYALLLVFPVSETYEKFRRDEDGPKQEYAGSGPQEEVVWYKQTIGMQSSSQTTNKSTQANSSSGNACGLIGLLHATCNGGAKEFIGTWYRNFRTRTAKMNLEPQSDLSKLLNDAIPLSPTDRADLLYESHALESAHKDAAARGDTAAPSAEENIELHYVCFVAQNGRLWELDGRRKGPLDRGVLDASDDVLSEKALDLGVRSFLKRESAVGGGDLRFSLIALAPSME